MFIFIYLQTRAPHQRLNPRLQTHRGFDLVLDKEKGILEPLFPAGK